MGDRGNIVVLDWEEGKGVYLYSHWSGSELPQILAKALGSEAGRGRADDPPYLTRIIFDVMTEGQHGEETGYGISASIGDGNGVVLVVNPKNKTVTFAEEGTELEPLDVNAGMSFADFVMKYSEES